MNQINFFCSFLGGNGDDMNETTRAHRHQHSLRTKLSNLSGPTNMPILTTSKTGILNQRLQFLALEGRINSCIFLFLKKDDSWKSGNKPKQPKQPFLEHYKTLPFILCVFCAFAIFAELRRNFNLWGNRARKCKFFWNLINVSY